MSSKRLSIDEIKSEYLKCATDFEYFAEKYLTVWDKQRKINIPFVLFPHQKYAAWAYQNYDEIAILKYRQGGMTTTTCGFLAWLLTFTSDVKVAVVADKLKLAIEQIFSMIVKMMEGLPDWMRNNPAGSDTKSYKEFANGAKLQAFAAGKDGVRGFSPDVLFVDEAAYLEHGDDFFTAAQGSLSVGGKLILNSTPKGLDPVYYASIDGSRQGRNKFYVVEIYWYEDPRFVVNKKGEIDLEWVKSNHRVKTTNKEEYEQLKKQGYKPTSSWFEEQCAKYSYDAKKIAQEIEGKFLGSGGNLIHEEYIQQQETEFVKTPIWTNKEEDNNFYVWEEPKVGANYLMGVDVSSGSGDDYSTIVIMKVDESGKEEVAEYQAKVAPEDLGDIVVQWAQRYNNAYVVIDVTGGIGVITMNRVLELGYPQTCIHYSEIRIKPVKDRLQKYIRIVNGKELVAGFSISVNRQLMLQELEKHIRLTELIVRSSRFVSEMKTFVYVNGRYDHMRGSHDDILMAVAMALYAWYSKGRGKDDTEMLKAMAQNWMVNDGTTELRRHDNQEKKEVKSKYKAFSPFTKYNNGDDLNFYQFF
jgi:phage FluMu gp28-like protein